MPGASERSAAQNHVTLHHQIDRRQIGLLRHCVEVVINCDLSQSVTATLLVLKIFLEIDWNK